MLHTCLLHRLSVLQKMWHRGFFVATSQRCVIGAFLGLDVFGVQWKLTHIAATCVIALAVSIAACGTAVSLWQLLGDVLLVTSLVSISFGVQCKLTHLVATCSRAQAVSIAEST